MYQLTDEGKKYLKEGLPERRLAEFAKGFPKIVEARKKFDDFNVGLMWAKKNEWIRIENGCIIPGKAVYETDSEKGLRIISEGKELSEEITSVLLKRKLIYEEKDNVLNSAKDLSGTEVNILTPELIKSGVWKDETFKPYNVEATGKIIHPGKRQSGAPESIKPLKITDLLL